MLICRRLLWFPSIIEVTGINANPTLPPAKMIVALGFIHQSRAPERRLVRPYWDLDICLSKNTTRVHNGGCRPSSNFTKVRRVFGSSFYSKTGTLLCDEVFVDLGRPKKIHDAHVDFIALLHLSTVCRVHFSKYRQPCAWVFLLLSLRTPWATQHTVSIQPLFEDGNERGLLLQTLETVRKNIVKSDTKAKTPFRRQKNKAKENFCVLIGQHRDDIPLLNK